MMAVVRTEAGLEVLSRSGDVEVTFSPPLVVTWLVVTAGVPWAPALAGWLVVVPGFMGLVIVENVVPKL